MKLSVKLIAGVILITCMGSNVFAGSIDYLSNQSADYIRTFSRNATLKGADAVSYNPAATAFFEKGMYVQVSNQILLKTYENKNELGALDDTTYKSDEPTYLLPNIYYIYAEEKWAAFAAFTIPAGGGKIVFDKGIPFIWQYGQQLAKEITTNPDAYAIISDADFEAESLYMAGTFGGAYAVNKMISVSLAGRVIYAKRSYKGSADMDFYVPGPALAASDTFELDAAEKALGFGAIVGVDWKATRELNVGFRFETPTVLDFETELSGDKGFGGNTLPVSNVFVDGEKRRRDLPAVIGLGLSYTKDKLTASLSWQGYLIGLSDQEDDGDASPTFFYSDGYDDDYDSLGWEAGLGVEYSVMPDFITASIGYLYSSVGGNEDVYNDFNVSLDAHSIGLGAVITPMENLDVTVAAGRTIYTEGKQKVSGSTVAKFNKDIWVFAFGAEYRI